MIKLGGQPFTTSSYTGPNGACVEVGSDSPSAVQVSDTKLRGRDGRPVLSVSPAAFAVFTGYVRT